MTYLKAMFPSSHLHCHHDVRRAARQDLELPDPEVALGRVLASGDIEANEVRVVHKKSQLVRISLGNGQMEPEVPADEVPARGAAHAPALVVGNSQRGLNAWENSTKS